MINVDRTRIERSREQMFKFSLIALSGLICAIMFAIGFGFVAPVSSAVGGLCDVLAVASGVFLVGLLDGE
jgi:F0F1-type ATP synthase assembly protein I